MSVGIDPGTGERNVPTELTDDEKQAQEILRRLVTQVEEQQAIRTKATMRTAIDARLKMREAAAGAFAGD